MWEKRTLWENAARVPLVIRAPWMRNSAGEGVSGVWRGVCVRARTCVCVCVFVCA